MKLIGILAIILSFLKFGLAYSLKDEQFEDVREFVRNNTPDLSNLDLCRFLKGIIVTDGLVELICGLFLMLV